MKSILKARFPTIVNWLKTRHHFWKEYYYTGEWELRELTKYVDRKRIAVDVGANIGTYSYHLCRLCREVIAFEPNPAYLQSLRTLKIKSLKVEGVALSKSDGTAILRIPRLGSGFEDVGMASIQEGVVPADKTARSIDVCTYPLDRYDLRGLGFIKIDVEGHEENVLQGASETIANNKPVLLIEIEERHNPGGLRRISDALAALGYDCFFFHKGIRKPLSEFDAAIHQPNSVVEKGEITIRRQLPYVNNFIFVPRDR